MYLLHSADESVNWQLIKSKLIDVARRGRTLQGGRKLTCARVGLPSRNMPAKLLLEPWLKVFYEPFDKSCDPFCSLLVSLQMSSDIDQLRATATIGVAVATGGIGLWLCRGRPRPRGR